MAVWPFLMGFTALLTVWGWTLGAWKAPAALLAGYVAMRGVMWGLPDTWHEVAAFAVWACVSWYLFSIGAWLVGAAFLTSGVVYPIFVIFGHHLTFMGVAPIIAEAVAIIGLLGAGGGLYGLHSGVGHRGGQMDHPANSVSGIVHLLPSYALGVAPR